MKKICLLNVKNFLFCIGLVLIVLSAPACGIRYMIRGQVVDAGTGKPVGGAAIVISWAEVHFAPPGLPAPRDRLETAEVLSDGDGFFQIPKYLYLLTGEYDMGVYKKGYVCWFSKTVFLPYDKPEYEDRYGERKWFRLTNGMVIRLEPLTEIYSRDRHADFTSSVHTRCRASYDGLFFEAIESEYRLWEKSINAN
jgi:hypothetical protein